MIDQKQEGETVEYIAQIAQELEGGDEVIAELDRSGDVGNSDKHDLIEALWGILRDLKLIQY